MLLAKKIIRAVRIRADRLKPRRFQSYCVGAAKTGTTSLAQSFRTVCRAQHEPEPQRTNRLVLAYVQGQLDREAAKAYLIRRDRRLRLEMESAHPLGYMAGLLAEAFPEARFVVTIREPLAWLRSRLNYHHEADPPAWREYRAYFLEDGEQGRPPEEAPLAPYGLSSLDTYLSQYADHYQRVFAEVPPARRLLVKTAALSDRLSDIARFIGAEAEPLERAHSKRTTKPITPLDEMDPGYVRAKIWRHCEALIRAHFPDRVGVYA
ncbi:MAG: sulfotransferase [Bacteroidota bacterium]